MTQITGISHLSLSVADVERSTAWYGDVLGFEVTAQFDGPTFRRARMRHPVAGITVTVTQHHAGAGEPFDEVRTGLDHLAFTVPSRADVEAFKRRFEERGVVHSDIREPQAGGGGGVITLRDPDNIQLEVFAAGAP